MSYYYSLPVIMEVELAEARRMLGTGLPRILGYFEEDGAKAISEIEQALASDHPAAMVIPAHTLKGESRQFGAKRLSELAEVIEKTARRCVERHISPDEVASEVAMLRGCFSETLATLRSAGTIPAGVLQPAPFTQQRAVLLASGPRKFGRRAG